MPASSKSSGVHVAMSNTLSTPTEALDLAYPLRVERHSLRFGSAGSRSSRSDDGSPRQARDGGADGEPGRNLLNGEELPPFATRELEPGDVLRIETPGGGGYGTT